MEERPTQPRTNFDSELKSARSRAARFSLTMRTRWFASVLAIVTLVVAGCSAEDPGERTTLAALVGPENVVVLGEIHGTQEFPAAVADAAAEVTRSGALTVALEWPRDDQGLMDAFLASAGSSSDRETLLSSPFWTASDGRTSTAILGLIEQLRELRAEGHDLNVLLFDIGRDIQLRPAEIAKERDRLMAGLIAEVAKRDQRPMLVLVGNLHAKKSGNDPPSMAEHLIRSGVDLVSLNASHGGGTAWVCVADGCGERSLTGRKLAEAPFVAVGGDSADAGYDGVLFAPTITAAPPAKTT